MGDEHSPPGRSGSAAHASTATGRPTPQGQREALGAAQRPVWARCASTSAAATRSRARAASRRRVARRMPVNGIRISRKTSDETRKPANRNTTPRNLPSANSSVEPARFSESVIVGKEGPEGDEDRGGHARVETAGGEVARGARERGDEVHEDRDRRDAQVEQELVARLVGVERVRQHPPLGHEHVGREHRSEQERQRARDVHDRRQQAQVARHRVAHGLAGRRVDRVAGRRQRRRQRHQHDRQDRHADDRGGGEARPPVVREVRLDADREREDHGPDQVQERQGAGARVVRGVADHQRDEAGQEQQDRVRVAEPGPAEEERRPEAEPRRPSRRRPRGTTSGRAPRSSRWRRPGPRRPRRSRTTSCRGPRRAGTRAAARATGRPA